MVNQIAIIPEASTKIEPLVALIDGFIDDTHRTRTRTGGEPLEDGREISDHAVALEEELMLEGWVSDFQGRHRPEDAWTEIRELSKNTALVEVITELGIYPEMIIRMAETERIGRGIRFRMELKEVLRVDVDPSPFGVVAPVSRGRVTPVLTVDYLQSARTFLEEQFPQPPPAEFLTTAQEAFLAGISTTGDNRSEADRMRAAAAQRILDYTFGTPVYRLPNILENAPEARYATTGIVNRIVSPLENPNRRTGGFLGTLEDITPDLRGPLRSNIPPTGLRPDSQTEFVESILRPSQP